MYVAIFLIFCGFMAPSVSEETAVSRIRLDTFLEQWHQQFNKNDEPNSFIHTGVFMTNDEWHDGIISQDGKIMIDLFIDNNSKDANVCSGQIIIHCSLKDLYSKLTDCFRSAILQSSLISNCNDIIGFYEAPHSCEYYYMRFVVSGSEQINGYGVNRHLKSYLYEATNEKNSINGQNVFEFIAQFMPNIDASQIDNYISHQRSEELKQIYHDLLPAEVLMGLQEMLEAEWIDYVFPYSDTIAITLACDPVTGIITRYTINSSVMGGEELFRQYMQLFFDISNCSLPIQIIDILARINGEEFAWRDVESIRNYPLGHTWKTMYLSDEDWCLYVEDDEHGIPSVTFYMYDERYERQNGWMW